MNSKIIAGIVIVLLIIGGVFFLKGQNFVPQEVVSPTNEIQSTGTPSVTPTPSTDQSTSSPVSGAPKQYTLADVAAHADENSCYTTINGNVYDLTQWIFAHPGGAQAILSICGKDGTDAFMAQHGGQGRPERELATFLIGVLK